MKRIFGWGLVRSLAISLKAASRGVITMQYPHEKWELPERSRWALAPKYYDDGDPKCTACGNCEKACPDHVIELLITQNEEDRSKHIDHYRYEIGACMMCGLCVEACAFDAIEMSHEYELARTDRSLLTIDLLTDVPADDRKKRAAKQAPAAEAATAEGGDDA
jgi:NADH-quinone oxidoreductase subunit I